MVLDSVVRISYAANLSAEQRLEVSTVILAAANLLNSNADKFTADEKKAIGQISAITVVGSGLFMVASGNGTMTLAAGYVRNNSAGWLASNFGHGGQYTAVFGQSISVC